MFKDWRDMHGRGLKDFVLFLNSLSKDFILKGGTSLMLCYNLTRFSEDIDLDALKPVGLEQIVARYCKERGYTFRIGKDTDTVKRYFIHYTTAERSKPVKVEISYRRKGINPTEYCNISNVLVYNIQRLLSFKLNAYVNRGRLRDLFDVLFICENYWAVIPEQLRLQVIDAFSYKGAAHVDYLLKTQQDDLINPRQLENDFLEIYNMLGLL